MQTALPWLPRRWPPSTSRAARGSTFLLPGRIATDRMQQLDGTSGDASNSQSLTSRGSGQAVLLGELGVVQIRVEAALGQQLVVLATFHDPAVGDDQDLVRAAHG